MIRHVRAEDRPFWLRLDRHLPEEGFARKVRDREGYVLEEDGQPAGLLRWNLFWDEIPFCTLLAVAEDRRGRGLGRRLFSLAAEEARRLGAEKLYISAMSAEESQAFYRAMGCVEALEYDPPHVEKEPCDVQMEYTL